MCFVSVCACMPACVYFTTDQQTICSSPLNEQSKQQESRLSPNLESFIGKYTQTHTDAYTLSVVFNLIIFD